MSVPYRQLLRMAGLRVNAIPGATQVIKDATYLASPLTILQLGSRDFNFSYIKDLCVAIVGEIIEAYAGVSNHPFRVFNLSSTATIAHLGQIPSTNSAGKPIVGVYGAIKDSSSGRILTKQSSQLIQTLVDDTDNFIKGDYYYFDIIDRILYHTRTNAVVEVCTFSASDELTSLNANGNVPLPDAILSMAVDGMSARMIVDDEFIGQAQIFASYYQAGLSVLRQGGVTYAPAPIAQSSVDPRVS